MTCKNLIHYSSDKTEVVDVEPNPVRAEPEDVVDGGTLGSSVESFVGFVNDLGFQILEVSEILLDIGSDLLDEGDLLLIAGLVVVEGE